MALDVSNQKRVRFMCASNGMLCVVMLENSPGVCLKSLVYMQYCLTICSSQP